MKLSKLSVAFVGLAVLTGCATTSSIVTTAYRFNQPVLAGPADAGGGASSRNELILKTDASGRTGTMRIIGSITDRCLSGSVDVHIEQTSDSLILLPEKSMAACYDTRITIRKDGSGGTLERRNKKSAWGDPWPSFDYGLKPL